MLCLWHCESVLLIQTLSGAGLLKVQSLLQLVKIPHYSNQKLPLFPVTTLLHRKNCLKPHGFLCLLEAALALTNLLFFYVAASEKELHKRQS